MCVCDVGGVILCKELMCCVCFLCFVKVIEWFDNVGVVFGCGLGEGCF